MNQLPNNQLTSAIGVTDSRGAPLAVSSGAGLGCCPHCHKTAADQDPHSMEHAVTATHYEPGNSNVVQCNWCGLSGPIYGTMEEAVEAWNKLPRHQWPEETTGSKALADVRVKHPNVRISQAAKL